MPTARSKARTHCDDCAIRERAICAYCGPAELEKLDSIKSYSNIPKGGEIVAAGHASPFVASIVHGVVALSQNLADGRSQIVGLQFPSDFVGGALRDAPPFDATAVSDVLLCKFERQAFNKLLKESPALRERLLHLTMDELDASRAWMTLLGQKTAREKVASLLLMIARRTPRRAEQALEVTLPITRAEMGRFLGLTIETVSRQLSSLRASGCVRFEDQRRFVIDDLARLAAEAGEPSDPSASDLG